MDGMSWVETLREMFADWLGSAVEAGVHAGLLAVVVLVVNVLFRRWLSAGQMGLLWGLVLLRLVVPIVPGSPLSLENLVKFEETQVTNRQAAAQPAPPAPAAYQIAVPENVRQLTDLNLPTAAVDTSSESIWLKVAFMAIPFVCVIGGVAGVLYTLANYVRFCRRVNRVPDCGDTRLISLWMQCCATAGM